MSMEDPGSVAELITALTVEVRRQGRAAVAAHAASEACLDAVGGIRSELTALAQRQGELAKHMNDDSTGGESDGDAEELIVSLLPVADAIDRVIAHAERLAGAATPPGALARLFGARDVSSQAASMAEATRVLRSSLEQAFERAGVQADRRVGIPVDGSIHRVVEAKDAAESAEPDTVLEVVRPGYSRLGILLREADVIASRPRLLLTTRTQHGDEHG